MQIALTKKLADAIGIKPAPASDDTDPFFTWTANWTNTFDRRKEEMVVMVNNATKFTVSIFGVKRNQFKDISKKMTLAIRNTLLSMNIHPEVVEEYLQKAGEIEFASNHDRKMAAWITRKCLDSCFVAGRTYEESQGRLKYDDTLGRIVSRDPVNYSTNYTNSFIPADEMIKALTDLTGKPAYKYRAFELLVTLDLEIYKATRRLIVPVNMEFQHLHKVIQSVYHWKNYHLYNFAVFDGKNCEPVVKLVQSEEDLGYTENAVLMAGRRLDEYLPENKHVLYTYDFGDNWEHEIELVKVIDDYDKESAYLLESNGQAPPEDVGGVGGFIDFREIMLDPKHPEHEEMKVWSVYWSPELSEWYKQPRVIHY